MESLLYVATWLVAGGMIGLIASVSTGRNPWVGLLGGLVLGPVSVILFVIDRPKSTPK